MQVVCIGPANVEIPFRRRDLQFIAGWARFLALPEGKHDLVTYAASPGTDRDEYVLVVKRKKRVSIRFTAPSAIQYKPAGSALNIAMGLAKLGASVRLVTSLVDVPHDDLSSRIRMYALGHQIQLIEIPRPLTPITFIILDGDDGGREKTTVLSYKPAYVIEPHDEERVLQKIQEETTTHVLATGIRLPELSLVRKAFLRGRQLGALNCFIPNPSILLSTDRSIRHQLEQVLPLVDVLQMNDREAKIFLGKRVCKLSFPKDVVKIAQQTRISTLIVTRGAYGAVAYVHGKCHKVTAYQATPKVVDTTGAGDAFLAGFIFALHEECTVDQAFQLAAFSATSNIMAIGGHGGMPSGEQLRWRLSQLRTPDATH